MKILLLLSILLSAAPVSAPPKADAILGVWANGSGKGHIQIYKSGSKYNGKIVWLKEPNGKDGKPKVDRHNPDPSKRAQPVMGMVMLRNFVFEDGEWTGGHVYNPSDGKEYKAYIRMNNPNDIDVRGYIGISLIGKTDKWMRVK
ncbi:MAG TPA: DUF2147 domain-containing protein [Chitinophagaceae bacterium]